MIWKAYLIGCIVATILTIAAVSNCLRKASITRGALIIYLAVILTSWFGLIVTAATFVDDTEWGKKVIVRNRNIDEK